MLAFLAALAAGLALLTYAADQFVVGAARLSRILSLSPVVIGAVVVGFGTSAPELVVSAIAAGRGDLDVGAGNIIGSNVANLTLILGGSALLAPMAVRSTVLRREAPLSVLSVLAFAVLLQGGFDVAEGVVLLALLVVALVIVIKGPAGADGELAAEVLDEFELEGHRLGPEAVRTVLGLAGTVAGASALVWGAEGIADRLGLSGGFIGLSLIAVGTSLPELVTAMAAARHREHELVVGNVLGSNLFNSLAVGGVVAILSPDVSAEESLRTIGVAFMVVVALVSLVLMITGGRLDRAEGAVLLGLFAAFLVVTYATQPDEDEVEAAATGGADVGPAVVGAPAIGSAPSWPQP